MALVVEWGRSANLTLQASSDALLEQLEDGQVVLEAPHRPGQFRTRRFTGELWKCLENGEGRWVTEDNPHLFQRALPVRKVAWFRDTPEDQGWVSAWTGGEPLEDGTVVLRLSLPPSFRNAMPPVSTPETRAFVIRVALGPKATWAFTVPLEKPIKVSASIEEMLRQYRKSGPVAVQLEGAQLTFFLVRKDICNHGIVRTVDFTQVDLLAFPSPDWRLSAKDGWIFADRIPLDRSHPIHPLSIWRQPTSHMTFLGEHDDRTLYRVEVREGKATATYETGDFMGCFGAGCGTPVNVRRVDVTLKDGILSSKVTRVPREE